VVTAHVPARGAPPRDVGGAKASGTCRGDLCGTARSRSWTVVR
jgi:hypothetical protein